MQLEGSSSAGLKAGAVEFGVVFDLDGVLVNTEELGWEVWRDLAGRHGLELTLEDLRDGDRLHGRGKRRVLQQVDPRAGSCGFSASSSRREFAAAKQERTRAYPDRAGDAAGAPSPRDPPQRSPPTQRPADVEAALARTGLTGLVHCFLGADQGASPKPAPDLYERAATMLARDVAVAVEDSPAGIASAIAAGLAVLAVDRGLFDPSSLTDATTVGPGRQLRPASSPHRAAADGVQRFAGA